MKTVDLHDTNLDACVGDAQRDRVIVTRGGGPVALVVGVRGLDEEQIQLGSSDEFWKLLTERRKEPTLDRSKIQSQGRPEKTEVTLPQNQNLTGH